MAPKSKGHQLEGARKENVQWMRVTVNQWSLQPSILAMFFHILKDCFQKISMHELLTDPYSLDDDFFDDMPDL